MKKMIGDLIAEALLRLVGEIIILGIIAILISMGLLKVKLMVSLFNCRDLQNNPMGKKEAEVVRKGHRLRLRW